MIKRHITNYINSDLKDKMVFVDGPRQVGETTLARFIAEKNFPDQFQYLNWDYRLHRKIINSIQFNSELQFLIFDEIHKYKHWKNYLKGLFDARGDELEILVTGSARLNLYRKERKFLFLIRLLRKKIKTLKRTVLELSPLINF